MSTAFYVKGKQIGTRFSLGAGNGSGFQWSVHPSTIRTARMFKSEEGHLYTPKQFWDMVNYCNKQVYDYIDFKLTL